MRTAQPAKDCFSDYVTRANSLVNVAKFCHVRPETVLTWQTGRWPRGESLYLLWAFLDFQDYVVTELAEIPKPTRQLLLIVASGQMSFSDVQAELKYQNLQDVYRLFRHGSGLTRDRAYRLESLVAQHLPGLMTYRQQLTSPVSADEASMEQISDATASVPSDKIEQSSLARLLRLAMKRSSEISSDELKRQLRDVSPQELEAFALLLLELV